jgi:ribosome-associated protein
MDIRKLQRVIVDALEDVKAQDIKVYNTSAQSDLFDRVVIASGTSNRQTKALAWRVAQQVKAAGGEILAVEGEATGEWVLVDAGDAIVHIMQPAIRSYYRLEEIWGDTPVRIKLGTTASRRAKESDA